MGRPHLFAAKSNDFLQHPRRLLIGVVAPPKTLLVDGNPIHQGGAPGEGMRILFLDIRFRR
jgi:hypothetical protein